MTSAILYARVSSARQEREGYSLAAQTKLLRDYAARAEMTVVEEVIETGSASRFATKVRPGFAKVLNMVRRGLAEAIVVVAFDRASRSPKDAQELLELVESGVALHQAQGASLKGGELEPMERFMFRMESARAELETELTSRRVRSGLAAKAEAGGWPHRARIGYTNVRRDGRAFLEPDLARAPLITEIFEAYASGEHSLTTLTEFAQKVGLTSSRTGRPIARSSLATVLACRLYIGQMEWKGQLYDGDWIPIVKRSTWDKVQQVLASQRLRPKGPRRQVFRFGQLVSCSECGSVLCGERKQNRKGGTRYTYYRCTEATRGRCSASYIREDRLSEAMRGALGELRMEPDLICVIRDAVLEVLEAEAKNSGKSRERLVRQERELTSKILQAGRARVSGGIPAEDYQAITDEWRDQREAVRSELEAVTDSPEELAHCMGYVLDLCRGLPEELDHAPPEDVRSILRYLMSGVTWDGSKCEIQYHPELKALSTRTIAATASEAAGEGIEAQARVWLESGLLEPSLIRSQSDHETTSGNSVQSNGARWTELAPVLRLPIPPAVIRMVEKIRLKAA